MAVFIRESGRKDPFFIELRNVNQFSGNNLLTYIYHSILQQKSQVGESAFLRAVHGGEFVFLLDGFDEIVVEKRIELERSIVEMAENNPKLTIVISGRPDDRFDGWHSFHKFNVLPLSKRQVISLLTNSDFDSSVKRRFIQKVKDGLYETHRSFLSNPLLASMMLIAYDHYNDIPEKMYLFYEQAFEAIYQRHDGSKAGFIRKFHSALAPDEFKIALSYFCLITYYEEKFEFTASELEIYISKSLRFFSKKIESNDVQKDFIESVCILQKDGLNIVFTHRSFQEYFAAYCISRVTDRKLELFFSKFSKRYNDQVIKMVFDMNKDLVVSKYMLPSIEKFNDVIKSSSRGGAVLAFMERMGASFDIMFRQKIKFSSDVNSSNVDRPYHILFNSEGELSDLVLNMERLMPNLMDRRGNYRDKDYNSIKSYVDACGYNNIRIVAMGGAINVSTDSDCRDFDFQEWFKGTGMYEFMKASMLGAARSAASIKRDNENIQASIDEIFSV